MSVQTRQQIHRRYYLAHREAILAQRRIYYQEKREACKARSRAWALAHPERVKEYRRADTSKRRQRRRRERAPRTDD